MILFGHANGPHQPNNPSPEPQEEFTPVPLPPDATIIVPVRNTVLFPGMIAPIVIGRPSSIAAAQQAVREERPIGILMQRDAQVAEPGPADMHPVGTLANIVRYMTAPDGTHHIICQGVQRIRILDFVNDKPFLAARVLHLPEPEAQGPEIEARFLHLVEMGGRRRLRQLQHLGDLVDVEWSARMKQFEDGKSCRSGQALEDVLAVFRRDHEKAAAQCVPPPNNQFVSEKLIRTRAAFW